MKTTKFQLIQALMTGGALVVADGKITTSFVIVNGIAREDGSNHSYLVTGHLVAGGAERTVHVRTVD